MRDGRKWLAAPGLWSPRRTAVEAVLALALGVMAAGTEELLAGGGYQALAVALAAALLSLLRRRLPATALTVTAALIPHLGGFTPLLAVVGWSAGRRIAGPIRALVAFTAAYAVCIGVTLLGDEGRQSPLVLTLLITLYFLATAVVPGLSSRYWTQRRTLLQALRERNAQLLRERAMVAGQARLRERQRIAQDMHDSLGHQLALISVHTGALEVDPELTERQREAVAVLRGASVTAMHELREVVGILRDGVEAPETTSETNPVPDESGRAGRGTAGIDELVETGRAAGNRVELRRSGEPRPLAAAADHAAYRIVQEALTNAYKHAPGAAICVELRHEPDSFVVEVVNGAADGGGGSGAAVSGGQGLTGLRERARLVGGMVYAGPADGGGFRVAGVLPYGGVEAAPFVGPSAAGASTDPDADLLAADAGLPSPRSRGGGVVLGCGIAVAAMVALASVAVFGLVFLVGELDKGMIEPAEYARVQVGADEDEVRGRLPDGDTVATAGLRGKGPEPPEGAECLVLMSSEVGESIDTEPVFRFCFKDGKLIEKEAYEVRR
ncbi:sensor histidine kinase [Streptomyces sp. MUM 178J]|uniref:sensor histidine kinase n=1 Tax=Streptomyces sp. MUM 178J TaxID=2791991 RepID=UPI001F043D58|nr:histidine kinase [Streptomyces sp. MUM 178J]WRQ83524.1 histidine kinase [Streptomyces sp. MUM 178J]